MYDWTPRIVEMTVEPHNERSFICQVPGDDRKFYLPRKDYVKPLGGGKYEIPEWLALKHRQICGDEAYEKAKR